jgi:hypothetical protein
MLFRNLGYVTSYYNKKGILHGLSYNIPFILSNYNTIMYYNFILSYFIVFDCHA